MVDETTTSSSSSSSSEISPKNTPMRDSTLEQVEGVLTLRIGEMSIKIRSSPEDKVSCLHAAESVNKLLVEFEEQGIIGGHALAMAALSLAMELDGVRQQVPGIRRECYQRVDHMLTQLEQVILRHSASALLTSRSTN